MFLLRWELAGFLIEGRQMAYGNDSGEGVDNVWVVAFVVAGHFVRDILKELSEESNLG